MADDTMKAMSEARVDEILGAMEAKPEPKRPDPVPELSFDGMPDHTDRDAYRAELEQRLDTHNTAQRQAEADWDAWRAANPEVAEAEVRRHASAVARELAADGASFEQIKMALPSRVQNRIAQAAEDNADDGRTAGAFGGAESGGRPVAPAPKATNFHEELKTAQEAIWK